MYVILPSPVPKLLKSRDGDIFPATVTCRKQTRSNFLLRRSVLLSLNACRWIYCRTLLTLVSEYWSKPYQRCHGRVSRWAYGKTSSPNLSHLLRHLSYAALRINTRIDERQTPARRRETVKQSSREQKGRGQRGRSTDTNVKQQLKGLARRARQCRSKKHFLHTYQPRTQLCS